MKKTITIIAVAVAIAAGQAFAGLQDFVLVNNTAHDILEVYATPTGVLNWDGDDMLGWQILDAGNSMKCRFSGYRQRYWDIKIVYADAKPDAEFYGVDLFTAATLVISDGAWGYSIMTPICAR